VSRVLRRALACTPLAAALACAPTSPGGEKPIETVDVAPAIDAAASFDDEPVEPPRPAGGSVAGVLPAGFPRDVPLPEPSSIVDFDERSVTFELGGAGAEARAAYRRRLAAAGFRAAAGDVWHRGARRIRVVESERGGAARVTLEILTAP
jgi:hypothetical protein